MERNAQQMPILVVLLIVALVAYFAYRYFAANSGSNDQANVVRSNKCFAYLSNGLLFYREQNGEINEMQSAYAQAALERRERSRERNAWKQGTSFGISSGGNMRNFAPGDQPLMTTSAAFAPNGDLFYFLSDQGMGGLFRYDASAKKELRLLHRQNLQLNDLCVSPDATLLAASVPQSGGMANIAILSHDGNALREVTGGDTVDSAPAWIPGTPNQLLFQSSGLGRNQEGYFVELGHASIQKLDMDSGRITALFDEVQFDHLKPRVCAKGNLHFIRRPYESPRPSTPNALLDMLLFPFRLLRAVFHYLNFFSLTYSRKPLTSATGPGPQADLKKILLQGRRIDAENAMRKSRPVQGVPSLVPQSWELVRCTPDGSERVLATSVAAYDIDPDGTVIYSNGRGVFVLDAAGSSELIHKTDLVAEVFSAMR
jgi:hypothetical protein